ncbi:MAG: DinB family protein [Gammaproteobacteria bacterium]|nr:DinB family protein [Gammaproteobacteria bacterium]MDE2346474.1 DinB family protein [Gammaproteobacteria bacterium]
MQMRDYVVLMSRYNQWMNEKLYAAAGCLNPVDFTAQRGAFFGSVCGTLNHIQVADIIWLKRFAGHPSGHAALEPACALPMPLALDQVLHEQLVPLTEQRRLLDTIIRQWADSLSDQDLEQVLHYANTKGLELDRPMAGLVIHFFNHQTHHRGQASSLLIQLGQDVGVTDLVAMLAEQHPR